MYTSDVHLRALAEELQLELVSIDAARLGDNVSVFKAGDTAVKRVKSWAHEVAPRLRSGGGASQSHRLVVVVWNGLADARGHYDAAVRGI